MSPRTIPIVLLACGIGVIGTYVAAALLALIAGITNAVFFQRLSLVPVSPASEPHSAWLILLAPIVGGLVVGAMARFGSEAIRGHGMPEAIDTILRGGSVVRPRVAILKPLSAAISIGTGGPFGAEGPIIMTGGAFGSICAQLLELTADERKTLLVAGAAAGMTATFNAPFASILLAVELLLFEWRPRSFLPVSAAAAVAAILRAHVLGGDALFPVAALAPTLSGVEYGLCIAAGCTGGILAIVATRLVYLSEDAFKRLPIHWAWWPALGGVIIGVGGLVEPRALGVGYDVIATFLRGNAELSLIVGILVVKTLIWSLSLGSGTSGGVLAPVFMIGAALGALEARVFPAVAPGFWSLISLAATMGGVMRSPLTGVIFALELSAPELVALGERRARGDLFFGEITRELALAVARAPARVDQHERAAQARARARQVGLDQRRERGAFCLAARGVAVAWQVDQVRAVADLVEVDAARAPGRRAGAREPAAPDQAVDQRRLPHVGAAQHGHLRQSVGRERTRVGSVGGELGLQGSPPPVDGRDGSD